MKIVSAFNRDERLQQQLQKDFPNVQFTFYKNMKELGDSIIDADVLLTFGEDVTEDIIDSAKKLNWIMVFSAGLEKLPHEKLMERNILVTNARGIHKIPMAEFAFAYMLQYAKQLETFNKQQDECIWNRQLPLRELYGSTLVVVGAGAIGSQIAKYGRTFGMKTIGINSSGKPVEEFDEIYPMSELKSALTMGDYIISVLPSTKATNGVFQKEQFEAMKNSAVFINMGRGNAVNETDLMEALENDELAHAFLDVYQVEPLPTDHPFWKSNKVTMTPHLSAISDQYVPRAMEIFRHNLTVYLNGGNDYINKIDLRRGY